MFGERMHFGGRGGPFGRSPRPGRPDFADFFGGPPPRVDWGVVRCLVLDAIAKQPRYGYEVITAIEERSSGTYRPGPGVVYPTLQMLEELGHARRWGAPGALGAALRVQARLVGDDQAEPALREAMWG